MSAETHDRIRRILSELSGFVPIKDDMIVHVKEEEHDKTLKKVISRLSEHGIMLNLDKFHFGLSEVKCFRMMFSKDFVQESREDGSSQEVEATAGQE